MLNNLHLNFFIAFVAGLTSFFASCFLPLIPVYLAYLSGLNLDRYTAKRYRWHLVVVSLYFVFGFSLTFMALGTTFHMLSHFLRQHRLLFAHLGGIFLMLMGLLTTGFIKIPFLSRQFNFQIDNWFKDNHSLHAFLTGMTFALAWSPCVGPVLGTILFWTASAQTLTKGLTLLFSYSLGLGLPFVLVAFAFDFFAPRLKALHRFGHYLQILTGSLIFLFGLSLLLR